MNLCSLQFQPGSWILTLHTDHGYGILSDGRAWRETGNWINSHQPFYNIWTRSAMETNPLAKTVINSKTKWVSFLRLSLLEIRRVQELRSCVYIAVSYYATRLRAYQKYLLMSRISRWIPLKRANAKFVRIIGFSQMTFRYNISAHQDLHLLGYTALIL